MAALPQLLSGWIHDAERVDEAVYVAITATATPAIDDAMRVLTNAADRSQLWIGASVLVAVAAGQPGRRAARAGLASIAVSSVVANLVIKPASRRRRPDRKGIAANRERLARMPPSRSFPSGHTASAFAFATAVGTVMPRTGVVLRGLAGAVAYSRIHVGVHFPGDVVAGAIVGVVAGKLTPCLLSRD